MRTRIVYNSDGSVKAEFKNGQLVAGEYYEQAVAPMVWGDIPDYESPVDGRVVSGRAQRREDLRRTGCRPWEGKEQELKEAARRRMEMDRDMDRVAEKITLESWHRLPEEYRRQLS